METSYPVVIIGGGLAGLSCARYLHKRGLQPVLLEASDAVGGRVRTDVVEGFRLDRGFQILLTAYPEAERLLDYPALRLQAFRSGAAIRYQDRFVEMMNPLREPLSALSTLTAPVGSLADKLRIVQLLRDVQSVTHTEDFFRGPATDTLEYLRAYGWSDRMISTFFEPFFGGVFLENELSTSSHFFRFVFKQFYSGDAALPAGGMQAIPEQLAAALPPGTLRLNTPVTAIDGTTVTLANGETLTAQHLVLATDAATADRLLGETPARTYNVTTCTYFAAGRSPLPKKLLMLNPNRLSPVHHLSVPSDVAPTYAPEGQALVSVSTQGVELANAKKLADDIRQELTGWFGEEVRQWRHLRTYHLPEALVHYGPEKGPLPLRLAEGLYRCGDYTAYPSLNAALQTGRQVAEMIGER
ncbi:NAD(P)/FAD-dependent oxidoreductase [Rhabdobacter roseus]|uniref:Phytoene dehydrogenase-like protein n=1 Tax=Rhabdobacter roseus TaxID=1655419 RepID=A0A840TG99_9BACT|nr:NAD(P)/FAD-dependent oxidoreductase [Rhabdobacter roseus]MBB5282504.1 phytoene dehydrogenase-like protein [Rhabdobacter roseus]